MARYSFDLALITETDLDCGHRVHLHQYADNGDHALAELAVDLPAPLTNSLTTKLFELVGKYGSIEVTIYNNDRRRRYDRDLSETRERLVFDKTSDSFALGLAKLNWHFADVRGSRSLSIIVEWSEN